MPREKSPWVKTKRFAATRKLDPALIISTQGEVKNAVIQIVDLLGPLSSCKRSGARSSQVRIRAACAGHAGRRDREDQKQRRHPAQRPYVQRKKYPVQPGSAQVSEGDQREVHQAGSDLGALRRAWLDERLDRRHRESVFRCHCSSTAISRWKMSRWGNTAWTCGTRSLGKTTQSVEVKAGEVTNVTFEFQMKK